MALESPSQWMEGGREFFARAFSPLRVLVFATWHKARRKGSYDSGAGAGRGLE